MLCTQQPQLWALHVSGSNHKQTSYPWKVSSGCVPRKWENFEVTEGLMVPPRDWHSRKPSWSPGVLCLSVCRKPLPGYLDIDKERQPSFLQYGFWPGLHFGCSFSKHPANVEVKDIAPDPAFWPHQQRRGAACQAGKTSHLLTWAGSSCSSLGTFLERSCLGVERVWGDK